MRERMSGRAMFRWLVIAGVMVCCVAPPRVCGAQDIAFYPDALNQSKVIERPGSVRDWEVAAFNDGALFLTDTELVFATWDTITVLQSGLNTPKHLFVQGDRYYFAEGSKLFRGVGIAPPELILNHSHQIDEILYGDAQHKGIAFVSLDRPEAASLRQELYIYNVQSGVATDQGIAVYKVGQSEFTGYEPRVRRRFVSGWSLSSSLHVLIGFRDVDDGIVAQIIWSDANIGNILGNRTEDWTFFGGNDTVYFVTVDGQNPNGFAVEPVSNPQRDIIGAVSRYHSTGPSPLPDPHHQGYLGFRFSDGGATMLTRFSSGGYQDIADVSTFAPDSAVANSVRLQMATIRGQVFFFNSSIPDVVVRLMPDDTLVTLQTGGSEPVNKSLQNIRGSLSAPGRGGSYRSYVEAGDIEYEITTMGEGSKFKLLVKKRFLDECPSSTVKGLAGVCGCNVAETDSDSDGAPDCSDECDVDPGKNEVGACGCGIADVDANSNGTVDCRDGDLVLERPSIAKFQRTLRVSLPRKKSVSYTYSYKFLDGRNRVLKRGSGRSSSGKRLSLGIPRRSTTFGIFYLAKGPGFRDFRSPEFRKSLK